MATRRPKKRRRLRGGNGHNMNFLSSDVLANIFGFLPLPPKDIMRARLNKKMRDAAKKAIVPIADIEVCSERQYNALVAMSTVLPNLQQITIARLGIGHKYRDGEDPDEEMAAYDNNLPTLDIEILSRFSKLRSLELFGAPLNGRYLLFNFPLLEKLRIRSCIYLKWDLEMLATGLPLLKELDCYDSQSLTGTINSLRVRVLKDTLEKMTIFDCPHVEGNMMDLADFPQLKDLDLFRAAVTGDIRDIEKQDFLLLKTLSLPSGVYSGTGYEFQRISDAPDVISTLHSFKKKRPALLLKDWYSMLSLDSPDWYACSIDVYQSTVPFDVRLVEVGSRVGYRWITECCNHPCEVIWLDPEPHRESIEYEKYIEEFQQIEPQVGIYQGFQQPPSEDEHNRLWAAEGYED
eukprot:scaffold2572_cov75-Skeletonema_marinoi.AAC.20